MEYLSLGKIIDTFGLDGTVKIYSTTSFSKERYNGATSLFLFDPNNDEYIEVHPTKHRKNQNFDFVKFQEINSIEEALTKKNCFIYIKKDDAKLPDNHYFFYELENCEIIDQSNNVIGKVIEVLELPSIIALKVKHNDGHYFQIPFIEDFVKDVNIKEKKINIEVVEGML